MANTDKTQITDQRFAGVFRRLFAIFYDAFLLIAILFIVTAIANMLNHGKAIESVPPPVSSVLSTNR